MLCCFGGGSSSAARAAHRRNTRQTASQIDAFVLPERTIDLDINPHTVPLPTPAPSPAMPSPAAKSSRKSLRRPPSPADPVLPDVQSTSSSRRAGGGRPSVDSNNTYPPTKPKSPRSGRAPGSPPQPAEGDHAPRLVSYHRPGAKGSSKPTSPHRPGSANRSQTSGLSQSQSQTTPSDTTATGGGGRVLSGPSTDEKRPRRTRRQHSTPQLSSHSPRTSSDQRRPPTAPSSPAYNQHLKNAHSFSSLGTAGTAPSHASSRPLPPQPKPVLPPVAPTSPLLGSTDWLPFRGGSSNASRSQLHLPQPPPPPPPQPASPVLLPSASASPIVVHRVTTSSRARHIDLLTGTVLQPGQDPPPRYEAG